MHEKKLGLTLAVVDDVDITSKYQQAQITSSVATMHQTTHTLSSRPHSGNMSM